MQTRDTGIVLLATLALITSDLLAQNIPHTFSPGAVIRASELNENFRAVADSKATTRILIKGKDIGSVLSADTDGIVGLTSTGVIFFLEDYGNRIYVTGESTRYPNHYFFMQPNCTGQPLMYFSTGDQVLLPSFGLSRLANGFLLYVGARLHIKPAGASAITPDALPMSAFQQERSVCKPVGIPSPQVPGDVNRLFDARQVPLGSSYVRLLPNDPALSGVDESSLEGKISSAEILIRK